MRILPLIAAFSIGCSAGDDWSEVSAVEADLSEVTSLDEPSGDLVLGQSQQAFIDVESNTGCFGPVPPFVQNVFDVGVNAPFEPSSFCGGTGAVARIFLINNYSRVFGRPSARPVSPGVAECADLELFYAVGRIVGSGVAPEIVFQGSDRGEVQLDGLSQPFCSIGERLVGDENVMPNGLDYYFAVQVVRDGSDGTTEAVLVSPN